MSSLFPAAYSTLSPDALAAYLGQRYGFAETQCQFLVRGVGDTYEVKTATGKYILRVYRPSHRTRPQIVAEIELLLAATEAGVAVSYPLANRDGQYIHTFAAAEGERHAVLFSYAPGHSVTILGETQLQSLGHQLARFPPADPRSRQPGLRHLSQRVPRDPPPQRWRGSGNPLAQPRLVVLLYGLSLYPRSVLSFRPAISAKGSHRCHQAVV